MGYLLADKDPAEVCAEYVVKVERLQKQVDELELELTECKAQRAGQTAIDCQTKIKVSVSKALKDYREVVCSD
jgi:phage shock protein A